MSSRAITIVAAMFVAATAAGAQERGTVEFGAFGSGGMFDKDLTLNRGVGGGGRVGVFLDPRIALEFEKGEMRASRTLGLKDVNVGILASHLVLTAFQGERLSLHLGAGAGASTETNFLHSYGVNALVGGKFKINEKAAFRVDVMNDWLANNSWQSYQRVHVGMSFFRRPNRVVQVVQMAAPAPVFVQREDSVSADEQARRRRAAQDYRMLRDSLNRSPATVAAPAPRPVTSPGARATMEESIRFDSDSSALTAEARMILDAKVQVFRAQPAMRIVIVGNTDARASDAYNMRLGSRRAAAAKAYLVAQGIDSSRIEVGTEGERKPTASGTSSGAEAENRRDEFRLLVTGDGRAVPPNR